MSLMRSGGVGRYYCNRRKRGIDCKNGRGVPADLLEDYTRAALHEALNDEGKIFELMDILNRRAERWNAQHALKRGERPALESKVKRLEREIEHGVSDLMGGRGSQAISDAIRKREAELSEAKAKLAAAPIQKLRKPTFMDMLEAKVVGPISMGDAAQVRDALQTLGLDRIVVTPLPKGGWSVTGFGDPGKIMVPIAGGSDAPIPPESSPPVAAPI